MLVYLFQRRRNADLVLTTDVTRSEPPVPAKQPLDLRKGARRQKPLGPRWASPILRTWSAIALLHLRSAGFDTT